VSFTRHHATVARSGRFADRRRRPARGGRFVRHRALGREAVYEVLEESGELVTVAVVDAPGLLPGTVVNLTATAVRAMERCDTRAPARAGGSGGRAAGLAYAGQS
jgi:hypothetical protein